MRPTFCLIAITLTIAAGAGLSLRNEGDPRVLPPGEVNASVDYSNILPEDYVGSDACRECHAGLYESWQTHPHSRMNQLPSEQSVRADFGGVTIQLPDARVDFTTEGEQYFMSIFKSGELFRKYVVTRTVGSRYMQYFIGKQLEGPEAADAKIYDEHMLPFAYWFALQRWFPRRYFDADGDESLVDGIPCVEAVNADPGVRPYTANCMNCHNTFPYAYRIFHDKLVGFPNATISVALDQMCEAVCAGDKCEATPEGFATLNAQLKPEHDLVSFGIGCESCHFGGREHVEQEKEMRYLPTSPLLRVASNESRFPLKRDASTAATINGICSQCHSGGGLRFPEGALKSNSGEAHDFQKGFCATQMSCVDCHNPHQPSESGSGFDTNPHHVESCLKCHPKFQDADISARHSGHDAAAGVSCLDCHMPRYNQGVNGLSRTHRICMPVEEGKMADQGANACNNCHIDRSFNWTLRELRKGWGVEIEPNRKWTHWERLDEPAVDVWRSGVDNHMRFVATECLSRYGKHDRVKKMIPALNDPEPLNRAHAENAIRRVLSIAPGERLPVDILATPADRRRQIADWLEELPQS